MTDSKQPVLSVVLACYNEAEHFDRSITILLGAIGQLNIDVELIFVDDGSEDDTWKILQRRLSANNRVDLVRRSVNGGRGQAVMDGFVRCRGAYAGYIDVDLEIHPLYLAKCVSALEKGADAVFGRRVYPVGLTSIPRMLASKGYRWLVHIVLGIRSADSESGLKMFRRAALPDVLARTADRRWFWDTEVVFWSERLGLRVEDVPCLYMRNTTKSSTVNLLRDTARYALDLTAFAWKQRRDVRTLRLLREGDRQYWEHHAEGFGRAESTKRWKQWRQPLSYYLKARRDRITPLFTPVTGERVLDVGCGNAYWLHRAAACGASAVGIDVSLDVLITAKSIQSDRRVSLVRGEQLDALKHGPIFDWVICLGLLDYVSSMDNLLGELAQRLAPGGSLIFGVPKRPSPFGVLRHPAISWTKRAFSVPQIANAMSRSELEDFVNTAGLELQDLRSVWGTTWIAVSRHGSDLC